MARVAVYGGSFHPPHLGHALVAAWAHWSGRADEVWLMPTFAHAFDKALSPFGERVALCEALAQTVGPFVRVCTVERDLEAPTYTIRSLDRLAELHPEHQFTLLIGADNLAELHKWREPERLEREYGLLWVGRSGYDNPPDVVVFPDISSTEIRRRLEAGEPVDHLLPPRVLGLLNSRR